MKKITIASMRESAGKTSIIVGLMSATDKKYSYIKPFGDRLIYKRKRNWDYDSNLIIDIFSLNEDPESITLGFDHAKLRYVFDQDNTKSSVISLADSVTKDSDILFIEGGKDLSYGASLSLDSLSITQYLESDLIVVVSGDNDTIIDDIRFLNDNISSDNLNLKGIIINKVKDIDEFEDIYLDEIKKMGVNIIGIIPYKEQLTQFTMDYIAEKLYGKIIAGESRMDNVVKNIFVGAMSTNESMRNPLFNKENKLLITSGDRDDMILAALESETVGILLTNNILPPSSIISKAEEQNIPMIMVTADTFQVTKQIDSLEALLTKKNQDRIRMLGQLVEKYMKLHSIFD